MAENSYKKGRRLIKYARGVFYETMPAGKPVCAIKKNDSLIEELGNQRVHF